MVGDRSNRQFPTVIKENCTKNADHAKKWHLLDDYFKTLYFIKDTYEIATVFNDRDPGGEGLVGGFYLQHTTLQIQMILLDEVNIIHTDHLQQKTLWEIVAHVKITCGEWKLKVISECQLVFDYTIRVKGNRGCENLQIIINLMPFELSIPPIFHSHSFVLLIKVETKVQNVFHQYYILYVAPSWAGRARPRWADIFWWSVAGSRLRTSCPPWSHSLSRPGSGDSLGNDARTPGGTDK